MTDVRQLLLDSMMASLPPSTGPSPNQDMVAKIGEQVNGAIVDEFLRVLDGAGLEVKPKEVKPQRAWLMDLADCTGDDCSKPCKNRAHWELRA